MRPALGAVADRSPTAAYRVRAVGAAAASSAGSGPSTPRARPPAPEVQPMDDQPALVELRTVGGEPAGGGPAPPAATAGRPRRRWCIAVIIPSLRACPCAWPAAVAA